MVMIKFISILYEMIWKRDNKADIIVASHNMINDNKATIVVVWRWRFGAVVATLVWSTKLLYVGPVSTGMGDRIGVQLPMREIYLSLTNHPGQLSLAIPPWVGAVSTGQRAVMLCDWGVKADMVLFAGDTVWSISERVRGDCAQMRYTNPRLLYFTYGIHSCSSRTLV